MKLYDCRDYNGLLLAFIVISEYIKVINKYGADNSQFNPTTMKKINIAPVFYRYSLNSGEVDAGEYGKTYFVNVMCKDNRLDHIKDLPDISHN